MNISLELIKEAFVAFKSFFYFTQSKVSFSDDAVNEVDGDGILYHCRSRLDKRVEHMKLVLTLLLQKVEF